MSEAVWRVVAKHMITQNELKRAYKMDITGVYDTELLDEIISKFILMLEAFKKSIDGYAKKTSNKFLPILKKAKTDAEKMRVIDSLIHYAHSSGTFAQHLIKGEGKQDILNFLVDLSSIRDPQKHTILMQLIKEKQRALTLGVSGHTLYGSINFIAFERINGGAIRDTCARYTAMKIQPNAFAGKTVLDLGCNVGYMLFETVSYGFPVCFGIEKDQAAVSVGNAIIEYMQFQNKIKLICAGINNLSQEMLKTLTGRNKFDVVFSLAVDGYIHPPDNYYKELVDITQEVCYFEPNNHKRTWNVDTVKALGFKRVEKVDVPYNLKEGSKRPCFICYK